MRSWKFPAPRPIFVPFSDIMRLVGRRQDRLPLRGADLYLKVNRTSLVRARRRLPLRRRNRRSRRRLRRLLSFLGRVRSGLLQALGVGLEPRGVWRALRFDRGFVLGARTARGCEKPEGKDQKEKVFHGLEAIADSEWRGRRDWYSAPPLSAISKTKAPHGTRAALK
jgi:hypothetical protein